MGDEIQMWDYTERPERSDCEEERGGEKRVRRMEERVQCMKEIVGDLTEERWVMRKEWCRAGLRRRMWMQFLDLLRDDYGRELQRLEREQRRVEGRPRMEEWFLTEAYRDWIWNKRRKIEEEKREIEWKCDIERGEDGEDGVREKMGGRMEEVG